MIRSKTTKRREEQNREKEKTGGRERNCCVRKAKSKNMNNVVINKTRKERGGTMHNMEGGENETKLEGKDKNTSARTENNTKLNQSNKSWTRRKERRGEYSTGKGNTRKQEGGNEENEVPQGR